MGAESIRELVGGRLVAKLVTGEALVAKSWDASELQRLLQASQNGGALQGSAGAARVLPWWAR